MRHAAHLRRYEFIRLRNFAPPQGPMKLPA
jgi:hypothetical protein